MAFGNINIMLFSGAKVFLSEKNPIYIFYKKRGAFIFSFQKELTLEAINTPLAEYQIIKNKTIIQAEFNYNKIIDNVKVLVTKII